MSIYILDSGRKITSERGRYFVGCYGVASKYFQDLLFGRKIIYPKNISLLEVRKRFDKTNLGATYGLGVDMENVNDFLKQVNENVGESAKLLQKTYNEVTTTYELLEPKLVELIKKIRGSRMTIITELKQILATMRDVRKFFLESDHKKEKERLEEFVVLCERMKALSDDGTLEALSDVILKIAVGKESER